MTIDQLKSKNSVLNSALWRAKETLLQLDTRTLTKQFTSKIDDMYSKIDIISDKVNQSQYCISKINSKHENIKHNELSSIRSMHRDSQYEMEDKIFNLKLQIENVINDKNKIVIDKDNEIDDIKSKWAKNVEDLRLDNETITKEVDEYKSI